MSVAPQSIAAVRPSVAALPDVPLPASWLLPSVGAVVFLVSLGQILFLGDGARTLFRDSDTGWHIQTGLSILDSSAIPAIDPFSFTKHGQPWFAWEWLSDVILAAAHRAGGLSAVALLAAVTIAATIWAAARMSIALGASLWLVLPGVALALAVTSLHWLARPHIFSWPLLLIFVWVVERERREPSAALWLLPAISVIWANVHASFLMGPGILLLYSAGAWLDSRTAASSRRFAKVAALCLAGTLANPYGWQLHEHVLRYMSDSYIMDHIAEFRSFSFHSEGAYYVEAFLAAAFAGIALSIRQRSFGAALLLVVLVHMGLYSARHLATAAVAALPLCAVALTRELGQRTGFSRALAYGERLLQIDRRVAGVVPVVVVLVLSTWVVAGRETGFHDAKFPVEAASFIGLNHSTARVFTRDQWGGYLIYRFGGRVPVFLDGRSDFYGKDLLETYATVMELRPGWNDVLVRYSVDLVMVPREHALASALRLVPEWQVVHTDPVAVVFRRTSS